MAAALKLGLEGKPDVHGQTKGMNIPDEETLCVKAKSQSVP